MNWAWETLLDAPIPEPETVARTANELAPYCGRYETVANLIDVTANGNGLSLLVADRPELLEEFGVELEQEPPVPFLFRAGHTDRIVCTTPPHRGSTGFFLRDEAVIATRPRRSPPTAGPSARRVTGCSTPGRVGRHALRELARSSASRTAGSIHSRRILRAFQAPSNTAPRSLMVNPGNPDDRKDETMFHNVKKVMIGVAALAALAVGGSAIAALRHRRRPPARTKARRARRPRRRSADQRMAQPRTRTPRKR